MASLDEKLEKCDQQSLSDIINTERSSEVRFGGERHVKIDERLEEK